MTNFKKSLIAASVAVIASPAGAVVFGDGLNDIEIINRENQYRLVSSCSPETCVLSNTIGTGANTYALVNPALVNNVAVGDIFVGVFATRSIIDVGTGTVWNEKNVVGQPIDTFTGYFVQEVKQFTIGVTPTEDRIILGTPTTDPLGILSAGETTRLYVDTTTAYNLDPVGGTVQQVVASMTDGTLWASLTVGADVLGTAVDNDGYLYSLINTNGTGTNTTGNFFTAFNVGVKGPAYNVNIGNTINDPDESLKGGGQAGDPALTAIQNFLGFCAPVPDQYACNAIVGNGQLSTNQSIPFPLGPWVFASEDPFQLYNAVPVPEPGSLALLGLGLAGLASLRRRRAD